MLDTSFRDTLFSISELVMDYHAGFLTENTANFNNFFHFLLERRKTLSVTREQILKPVLDKIRFASVLQHSPFAHCHLQLQECVRKQIVVLYCPDDKDLHVLKFPLAKFLLVSGKKKICRLGIRQFAQSQHNLQLDLPGLRLA